MSTEEIYELRLSEGHPNETKPFPKFEIFSNMVFFKIFNFKHFQVFQIVYLKCICNEMSEFTSLWCLAKCWIKSCQMINWLIIHHYSVSLWIQLFPTCSRIVLIDCNLCFLSMAWDWDNFPAGLEKLSLKCHQAMICGQFFFCVALSNI